MEGVKSVEENFKEFASVLTKFGVAVERLTGRDSKEDTERIIQAFKNGDVQVS